MPKFTPALCLVLLASLTPTRAASAQSAASLSAEVLEFVSVSEPSFALSGVRVVDGTGASPLDHQTIVVADGLITEVGPRAEVEVPDGARVVDLANHTVIPGIIGMHNHTDYAGARGRLTLGFSAPRMYLASGVTATRTTGSMSPYIELNLKHSIDAGETPGPRMYITGPRLSEGLANYSPTGEEQARRIVRYWAEEGASWIKAHSRITRANLAAAIDEAHRQGIKFTGHVCSVTYSEAIDMGIDNLEHGVFVSSDFVADKEPDVCPPDQRESLVDLDVEGPEVQALIQKAVDNGVAITSTLAVVEQLTPDRPVEDRVLEMMSPEVREAFLERHRMLQESSAFSVMGLVWNNALAFEKAFVDAGGLLVAGVDPTGNGGAIPGFGDQRNFELLIEAGFTPLQAVEIMTANGAKVLGEFERVGSITAGKWADMVVISGDPVSRPAEIRNVEIVFKDGVGYDAAKLLESVRESVGAR
ncbi:MAG: amidohydrolase family protein [Gemmatimonadetes bacterium]|nr:amidohydrolase family protein [Gemmatimonadota bacterium]MYE92600.1 amidohydrolase family protein [Gemmatimonadota bacterium]MYJ12699.1 amidohydrolase family protein [Gemmatimonadota bacterium]